MVATTWQMRDLVPALRGALYACGQVARALQGQVAVDHKTADSVHQQSTAVTLADRVCQEIILLRAAEVAPDLGIYSEELAACPAGIRALFSETSRYVLVIDPIDGTDDYVDGRSTYGHMVGVLDEAAGTLEAGLAYFPEPGWMVVAQRGAGVWRAEGLWGPLTPWVCHTPPATVGETKRLSAADRQAMAAAGFDMAPTASRSAIYELLRAASGELGAVVMRHFHGHDSAVGSLVVELLGGAALAAPGEAVRYDRTMARMPLVVASLVPEYAERLASALSRGDG